MGSAPSPVTLIDASGIIFRAYHALPPLTNSQGTPTNAVLGFTRVLLKLLHERGDNPVALAWDLNSRDGRRAIDPAYKANRTDAPEDLAVQFDLTRRVAEVLGIPVLEYSGWEADDVIATALAHCRAEGVPVEIVASDKDYHQLLGPGATLFDPNKNVVVGPEAVEKRYGVKPSQWCDFQALIGDTVDNIPKVPGVGEKTAARWLTAFGTLEALLANIPSVPEARFRPVLEAHREQILRARKLVELRADLPLSLSADTFARRPVDEKAVKALFTELDFRALLDERKEKVTPAPAPTFAEVDLPHLLRALKPGITAAVIPVDGGFSFAADGRDGAFLPLAAIATDPSALTEALAEVKLITDDGKRLWHSLAAAGVTAPAPASDIRVLSYLLHPSRKEHGLVFLARELLARELPLEASDAAAGASWAQAALELSPHLWEEAEQGPTAALARELELPLVPILAKMESVGLLVDPNILNELSTTVQAAARTSLEEIHRLAGHSFNVASPSQLAKVLFEELGLPVQKRTKSGPSTEHEVMEKLAELHPLPRAIIEYRNYAKLQSTYLAPLPSLIQADGRIHSTFDQTVAVTGRLSSINPNLQNIPIRTELGRNVRAAFIAPPGHMLVSADYDQVELRILAHLSRDEGLIAAFRAKEDVHTCTAALVFDISTDAVTPEHRRTAKMVNYGIAYGLSAHGLAARLGMPRDEATKIIDGYFARFPGIAEYMRRTIHDGREHGYVESLYGRRRPLPELRSKNRGVAAAAERMAINTPIQGTAADIIKRAMLAIDKELSATTKGRLLIQIHDELLFEVPTGEAEAVKALAVRAMTSAGELVVPLEVSAAIGHSWAEVH